ncbi:MAG: endonuclease domain-containing protein [Clostridia bacterium]|nr:endonuclease domain-containing protein [Clostridia bacterium]
MQRKHNKSIVPTAKTLRKNMTKEEKHLWYDFLRLYPVRFSKQKVLGQYIADFYCAKAKLVIELDGSQHLSEIGIVHDSERTAFLEQYDLQVIRIPNQMIWQDFDRVCAYIDDIVQQSLSRLRDSSLYTREP